MTAKGLIDIARARLGDTKQNRWTDTRMLHIVNQGQANLCKLTGIYRKEAYISIANDITRYRLPDDCMTIRRLEYNGEVVVLLSRTDIDEKDSSPNEFAGIKDNLGMGLLDIYPAVTDLVSDTLIVLGTPSDDTFDIPETYGVVTNFSGTFGVDPLYGVITGVEYRYEDTGEPTNYGELASAPEHILPAMQFNPDVYGVTTDIEYTMSTDERLFGFITSSDVYRVVGQYGITTSIADEASTLKVFYEAVPTDLTSESTTLVIPDMWEEAMVRYIVGTALQDDNDANNIQRGETELQKYLGDVLKAREIASKDFSGGTQKKLHTRYRRI